MSYYAVEIIYDGESAGFVKRRRITNISAKDLLKIRENIFTNGLYVPSEECPLTEGEIISPFRVRKVFVSKQETKFE